MKLIKPAVENDSVPPVLLPVLGIQKHFGLSRSTLYRWLDAGKIESVHIGRSRYIVVSSVYAAIANLPT